MGMGPACQVLHPLAFPSGSWATFPMRGKVPYNKASLLAVAIKGDPRCYNCGKLRHWCKDCLSTPQGRKGNCKLSLRIVHAVARTGIVQRNDALNLTKTANLFRETSKGAPVPAPPTPIAAFRTAINIRECREMHIFRPSCSHLRKHRGGLGHRQRAHLTGTGSSNYGSHWCLGTCTPRNGWFNRRDIQYYYQRHFCSARAH